ncbi:MAG: sigma factor-like helix-turn-helix DNA-binding protein [Chloroflexota bacterium]
MDQLAEFQAEREPRLPPDLKDRLEDAEEKVRRVLRVSKEPISLEIPVDVEHDRPLHEFIEDNKFEGPVDVFERQSLHKHLESSLEVLSDGEYRVIEMRFGLYHLVSHTLQEIGDEFELTRERIRQIEEDALRKLKCPARARGLGIPFGLEPPHDRRSGSSSDGPSDSRTSPATRGEQGKSGPADTERLSLRGRSEEAREGDGSSLSERFPVLFGSRKARATEARRQKAREEQD